jgi:formylglycine-generating enzyme required for sulfatase activity
MNATSSSLDIDLLLAELAGERADHQRRAEIGLHLAQIGDPRCGVGLVNDIPDILWRTIPAGELQRHDSWPCRLSAFQMAAYPVTNAQFGAFVSAKDGILVDRWWDGLVKDWPLRSDRVRDYGNFPATNVTWDEATAFCRWLGEKLGREVRLAEEWEWQWAAQSARPDFSYPWGSKWREGTANTREAWLGCTTAVGLYPGGQTLQGVFDLVGNVWEWCRNSYVEDADRRRQVHSWRSVRGGSCLDPSVYARAAYPAATHEQIG